MKVTVDGKEVLELTEIQKKVIQYNIPSDIFTADMERRVGWKVNKEIDTSFRTLKVHHDDKLTSMGITNIPLEKEAYATAIFANKDYKSFSKRVHEKKKEIIEEAKAILNENRGKYSKNPDFIKKEAEVLAEETALGEYTEPEFRESIIKVDNKEVLRVNATNKKILAFTKADDTVDGEIEKNAAWILQHKYERCFERLQKEWNPKLKDRGITEAPVDKDAYAELVFAQPDYKDRKASDLEEEVPV